MTDFKSKLTNGVKTASDMLCRRGFSAFLVGGCVRDMLMWVKPQTFDIVTDATYQEILQIFHGFSPEEIHGKYRVLSIFIDDEPIDIKTLICEKEEITDGKNCEINPLDRLEKDLAGRDFTMNAIGYDLQNDRLIDPFNGQKAIENRVIQSVSPGQTAFLKGITIMRALRFSACLGFEIEEKTGINALNMADELDCVATERKRDELSKLICGKYASRVLDEYFQVILKVIPQLEPLNGFEQHSKYHHTDVFNHTLDVLSATPQSLPLRMAALLHDIAKPQCFTMGEDGRGHFYFHEEQGAELVQEILKKLKYSNKFIEEVAKLVLYHRDDAIKDSRWVREHINMMGSFEGCRNLLTIMRADAMSKVKKYQNLSTIDGIFDILDLVEREKHPCFVKDLVINGRDLEEIHIEKERIGAVLQCLLQEVLCDPQRNTRKNLLELAAKL